MRHRHYYYSLQSGIFSSCTSLYLHLHSPSIRRVTINHVTNWMNHELRKHAKMHLACYAEAQKVTEHHEGRLGHMTKKKCFSKHMTAFFFLLFNNPSRARRHTPAKATDHKLPLHTCVVFRVRIFKKIERLKVFIKKTSIWKRWISLWGNVRLGEVRCLIRNNTQNREGTQREMGRKWKRVFRDSLRART